MTFTPGGFEQSRVLSLGMKYNCSWAVSYTHLDVYKRQAKKEYSHFDWYYSHVVERFERLKMKIIGYAISLTGETLCSCLLYTSRCV